jgi:hypothetical protein
MKPVDLVFKKVDIVNFIPQNDLVSVRILFNDGKEKALVKQCTIDNPGAQIVAWLSEIRQKEKEAHKVFTLDDSPLAGTVVIRCKQDEEEMMEKMARFLQSVKERIRSGKLARLSYYDLEKKIKGMTLNLEEKL